MDVLLVEDDSTYATLVERTLARQKHMQVRLTRVETLNAALSRLDRERFDVVLVDLNLPDASGTESVRKITLARNRIPAIVLSNNADEEVAIKVIQEGAQDYLVKGAEGLLTLHRTIRYAIERKAAEFRLKQLASYDSLTNLANRQELYFQMEKACAHADRHGEMVALFLFDLDKFKRVNDGHGHHAGDALLRAFARQLESSIRTGDTAARIGGDEFAVVLEGIPNVASAMTWSKKVLNLLSRPFTFEGHKFSMSASIGGAIYPAHGSNVDTLMHSADLAMYKVKNTGRKGVALYDEQMDQTMMRRRELESSIRSSLDNGEFQPYYQPKISLDTFEVLGLELLCRWIRPHGDVVMPGEFLPIAQSARLLPQIGRQMRCSAAESIKRWKLEIDRNLPVSLNVDAQELAVSNFGREVVADFQRSEIDGSLIQLEIPETLLLEKSKITMDNLACMREYGIKIAVDGFGAGNASLYYLRQFSIDSVKLDDSLISTLGNDHDRLVILRTIIGLATELGLSVSAKGIETANQLRSLVDMGCHEGQGYLIGRPVPAEEIVSWIAGPAKRIESRLEGPTGSFRILDNLSTLSA